VRFASLGSGSRGNALVVEAGHTRVMLDCGFSFAETKARLARHGLAPHDIHAIIVTHEHDDHVGGVQRFAQRVGIPVYLTTGTRRALRDGWTDVRCELFDPHEPFQLGEMVIRPFPVPHDAREPAQFVFDNGVERLGVLTDAGIPTPHIRAMLSGCSALVLECNHDAAMLQNGPYSPALKARIGSRYGHLQNDHTAELLCALDRSRLKHVVAAHLSETNNTPALARAALAAALGADMDDVHVASQAFGVGWLDLL
jgi:phosphoribosyl 1,2-cyclic phosphodiesterase